MLGGRICRRGRWAALLAMAAVSAMATELVRVGARAGAAEERARKAEATIEELQAENARLREAAAAEGGAKRRRRSRKNKNKKQARW